MIYMSDLDDEELFWTRFLNQKVSREEIEKYIRNLQRQIIIKNNYLDLIWQIGYDYDGCNTIKSLKELIDELIDLATKGLKNDDKSIMYIGANGINKNILFEKVDNTDE